MRAAGLIQDLTYWPPAGSNQHGVYTYGTPIVIKGRWEERTEEVQTIGGETINSAAVIFVDRDLAVNGYIAEGSYVDAGDPTMFPGAAEIRDFRQIPDLRGASKMRRATV